VFLVQLVPPQLVNQHVYHLDSLSTELLVKLVLIKLLLVQQDVLLKDTLHLDQVVYLAHKELLLVHLHYLHLHVELDSI